MVSDAPDVQHTDYVVNILSPQSFPPGSAPSAIPTQATVTSRFFSLFPDAFDVINVVYVPGFFQNRFHYQVRNAVKGIGTTMFDQGSFFGSPSHLLGITVFPSPSFFDGAESGLQHEFAHQWINYLNVPPLASGIPHWPLSTMASGTMGFSIPPSGEGGSFPCLIVPDPAGVRLVRNPDQPVFGDLDLYLMGLLPANQVGEQIVLASQDVNSVLAQCNGSVYSGAFTRLPLSDITSNASIGPRIPDASSSQKQFRLATIIVTRDALLSPDAMAFYSYFAQRMELQTAVPIHQGLLTATAYPFAISTRGLGSMIARITSSASPSLRVSSTHIGSFLQGQNPAMYTISIENSSSVPTNGEVSVTDTLPAGLVASTINGPGWTCTLSPLSCSRSDVLPAGARYPPVTVTVAVSPSAAISLTNQAGVSGGGAATATSSDPTEILPAFVDVSPTDLFLPAIDLLKEYGVTSGCQSAPPQYCPNDSITEAQMAVFVVRFVLGGDNFSYTQTPYFSDVPPSNLYFPWIQKMQDLGIAVACGPVSFCPNSPVTRGIMSVLIIRGRYRVSTPANYPAAPYFTDVRADHSYFPWIQKMKQQGITTGCSPTTYCPDDPVTRGQMAVFIMRGGFNCLLPSTTPIIAWISAAEGLRGGTVAVTIAGQNTNFLAGVTQVSAGPGITVSAVTVINPTTVTAQLTISPGAETGSRSITVVTGGEDATLPNGFLVR